MDDRVHGREESGKLRAGLDYQTERMQRYARAFSPWGTRWFDQDPPEESLA